MKMHDPLRNNQINKPMRHFLPIYQSLDPAEIARRCNLEFNDEEFSLRLLGAEYSVPHPGFALCGKDTADPDELILIIRYLCEGKWFPFQGRQLSYHEIPWGEVYYRNFERHCLKRCAFAFGRDTAAFTRMIQCNPQLRAEPQKTGDASFRIEFINDLYITIILWQGDDEFPPSAQILFDDNFVFAFTAEDLAVAGQVIINRLKKLSCMTGGGCSENRRTI